MSTISRDELKKRGLKRFFNSFVYAWSGVKYAYRNEQNLTIHAWLTLLICVLGFVFKISVEEWLISLLFIGLIIATELINTALEALVDLVTDEYHPLAKVAKDTASGAVLALSITAAVGGTIIFLPKIINFIIDLF